MKDREVSRKRAYAPKVKSGCLTCKVRRIKCGEEKPFCKRCVDTGRKCDGYVANTQVVPRQVKIQPRLALSTVVGDVCDELSLDCFARDTAPKISGFYDQTFWSRIVAQLGHNEPVIRLAIQAVNVVHQQVEKSDGSLISRDDPKFLSNYNAAIAQFCRQGLKPGDRSHVDLIVVALFICLEFLLNNEEAAATHINGGLKILDDWQHRAKAKSSSPESMGSSLSTNTTSSTSSRITSSEADIMDEMAGLFRRLEVHSKIIGKQMTPGGLPYTPTCGDDFLPRQFTTLIDAQEDGFKLMSHAIGFIAKGTPCAYRVDGPDEKTQLEQMELARNLMDWRRGYEEFMQRARATMTKTQIRNGSIVHCLIISSYIWTCTCLSPYELDYDAYKEQFAKIIELATDVVEGPSNYLSANLGRFQFDMGLIPSLHLVGTRCREPVIRDQCLQLLSKHHWREGLFDSFKSARFIMSCVEIEELNKRQLMGLHEYELPDYLPCEGARIHFVGMDAVIREDGMQQHSFYSKPFGSFGDWHVQQAYLPVSHQILSMEPTATGIAKVVPNSAYSMPNVYTKTKTAKSNEYEHLYWSRGELATWPRVEVAAWPRTVFSFPEDEVTH